MQTIPLKIMLALFAFIPFYLFSPNTTMIPGVGPIDGVKKALNRQVNAWNNGDLEKAMSSYWNSPSTLWVTRSGIQKGYHPVLDGFRKEFADSGSMGIYSYEPLHMEVISATAVYFVIRWKIILNGVRVIEGVSSQVWKKIADQWMICAEHTS